MNVGKKRVEEAGALEQDGGDFPSTREDKNPLTELELGNFERNAKRT